MDTGGPAAEPQTRAAWHTRCGPQVSYRPWTSALQHPSRAQCLRLRLLTSLIVSAWLSFAGAAPGRLMITGLAPGRV